mgnify:CR=1 FL=1
MRIICDENIPLAGDAFGPLGDVRCLPGRAIAREDVMQADALIVRSVTRVDQALLDGSPVRFVGTATIGTDHVDTAWLASRSIAFASAAGCNSLAVVQWAIAALLELTARQSGDDPDAPWNTGPLGIVGQGNIGRPLAQLANALGWKLMLCDPPRQAAGEQPTVGSRWCSLREIAEHAHAVTFHVPLTRHGGHPTFHMVDAAILRTMQQRGVLLLNAARGEVIATEVLQQALASQHGGKQPWALDVFEGEPAPAPDVIARAAIATPHIAGYSLEGKLNGTRMMLEALLASPLGRSAPVRTEAVWQPKFNPPPAGVLAAPTACNGWRAQVRMAVRQMYDVVADSNQLKACAGITETPQRARHFDDLRKHYPHRREFSAWSLPTGDGFAPEAREALAAMMAQR